jgi:hypothetical protein
METRTPPGDFSPGGVLLLVGAPVASPIPPNVTDRGHDRGDRANHRHDRKESAHRAPPARDGGNRTYRAAGFALVSRVSRLVSRRAGTLALGALAQPEGSWHLAHGGLIGSGGFLVSLVSPCPIGRASPSGCSPDLTKTARPGGLSPAYPLFGGRRAVFKGSVARGRDRRGHDENGDRLRVHGRPKVEPHRQRDIYDEQEPDCQVGNRLALSCPFHETIYQSFEFRLAPLRQPRRPRQDRFRDMRFRHCGFA